MKLFVDKVYSSIKIVRSETAKATRRTANKKYAESVGAHYDEEYGEVLLTIDLPDDLD